MPLDLPPSAVLAEETEFVRVVGRQEQPAPIVPLMRVASQSATERAGKSSLRII